LKCGKGNTTCIAVTDDGELCVTGSCTLKLWQFKTQTLLKTLTGHSSDITNLSFINQQYFISTAANDRHIAAWWVLVLTWYCLYFRVLPHIFLSNPVCRSVSGESTDPVARFALSDSISSKISVMENGGTVHLAAVTKSGIMHFFQQQLNG
jgi:WD40 repeat protein